MDTLILTKEEIESLADDGLALSAVEDAFRLAGLGKVHMPAKSYLTFEKYAGDLRCMPAYIPEMESAGVKVVNSHPNNAKHNLPTVMAIIVLNDPETGYPKAIMSATVMTALRTAAGGALATKVLARADVKTFGFIGAGTQAYYQMRMHRLVRKIESVKIFDIDSSTADNLAKEAEGFGIKNIEVVTDVNIAAAMDVVVTTTPGRGPVCDVSAFSPGSHINAIGADAEGKQELPFEILSKACVVIDNMEQATHSGEINVALHSGQFEEKQIYAELGEIVAGKKSGRSNDEQITIFDSTGLAIQDITLANAIYQKAVDSGVGNRIQFF